MKLHARSLQDTERLAADLAHAIKSFFANAPKINLLVGLSGDLGAGKTAFVQAFVRALSPDEDIPVTSPTFALVHEYPTEPPVTHLDLYRLASLRELEAIGYQDFYDRPGVTMVEWIERVPQVIPVHRLDVVLSWIDPQAEAERKIQITAHGSVAAAVLDMALRSDSLCDRSEDL